MMTRVLWDRTVDGGFPETKELKRRVRDVIEPQRNLGHVDRHSSSSKKEDASGGGGAAATSEESKSGVGEKGEDAPTKTGTATCAPACSSKQDCADCE